MKNTHRTKIFLGIHFESIFYFSQPFVTEYNLKKVTFFLLIFLKVMSIF